MLRSSFLALSLTVVASGIGVHGQAPATPKTWLFIDTPRIGWRDVLKEATAPGSTQIAKVRTALIAAGEQGYQVRASTGSRELASAGAEGFRIALTPVSNEAVFLMEREPGASEKVEYSVAALGSNTASRVLERATGEGYRVVAMLGDFAVLERPAPRIVTEHREQ